MVAGFHALTRSRALGSLTARAYQPLLKPGGTS